MTEAIGAETSAVGRVVQVSTSPGGVPKLPVERAWVGRFGLEGDAHREATIHGGPHRAVALFAIEAIRRVAAEGHPIAPGTCGENLTTEGIEWSTLPVGTRFAVGERLVLELASPDNPCSTIEGSFSDRRSSRISILTHPSDSRMYARVVTEGEVRPGDPIVVLPVGADDQASELALRERLEAARRRAMLAVWQATTDAGLEARIVDAGELAMVAAPSVPGRWRNRAVGLTRRPDLLERALAFFADQGIEGWLELLPADLGLVGLDPTAANLRRELHGVEPDRVRADDVAGLAIREVGPAGMADWAAVTRAAEPTAAAAAWVERMAPHLRGDALQAPRRVVVGELDGRIVATAMLYVHKRVGWLTGAAVLPEARGRGIQRALLAARAGLAAEAGCDLVAAEAIVGSTSEANLRRAGLVPLGIHVVVPVPRTA